MRCVGRNRGLCSDSSSCSKPQADSGIQRVQTACARFYPYILGIYWLRSSWLGKGIRISRIPITDYSKIKAEPNGMTFTQSLDCVPSSRLLISHRPNITTERGCSKSAASPRSVAESSQLQSPSSRPRQTWRGTPRAVSSASPTPSSAS